LVHVSDLLFSPRASASFDLSDSQILLVGASAAFGPNASGEPDAGNTTTQIYGLDLTWKWKPLRHHGGFPFLSWQTEAILRHYDAGAFDWDEDGSGTLDPGEVEDLNTGLPAVLPGETLTDYGFYTQWLYGFRKGWVAGLRLDYLDSERADYERRALALDGEALGRDPLRSERWRMSPNLTYYPSEFSKLRLQYNVDHRSDAGTDHSVWLQFEFLIGAQAFIPSADMNSSRLNSRSRSLTLALLVAGFLMSPGSHAALNLVATIPDFGAIAQAVGGNHVRVTTLAKGPEDAHFVDPRPSFIRSLNQADLLLHGGAELELGWLPPLLQNARNPKILPGQPGNIIMAEGIQLLEIPTGPVDRSAGDVHVYGNPHYWLDPLNGVIMAEHLAKVLSRADPDHAAEFAANAQRFQDQLRSKTEAWTAAMKPLRGTRILTYHKTYPYFAQRFGLEIVGELEPKPGIEPSPAHLRKLIPHARDSQVKFIVIESFRPHRTAETVAKEIGARVLILPDKVGAVEKVKDYFDLFDYAVAQLTAAVK
jgi:ABC-type Zn uptake system ZnuABC Zn-binding protein ZnuA